MVCHAAVWAARRFPRGTDLSTGGMGQARSLLADAVNMRGHSIDHDVLRVRLRSHHHHSLDAERDAVDCIAGYGRKIGVCFRPNKSAALLIYHSTPLASAKLGTAVCVLHLRYRSWGEGAVAKAKGIDCRSEDSDRASVPASRPRLDVGCLEKKSSQIVTSKPGSLKSNPVGCKPW